MNTVQRVPRSTGDSDSIAMRAKERTSVPIVWGEGLEEGAAARGAGLVDGDGVHRVVADAQVLHVLAADVDDRGDPGLR